MASGSVRKALQRELVLIAKGATSEEAGEYHWVRTFDTKLEDKPIEELPYVVVTVRQKNRSEPGEIGTVHDIWTWEVHIYYLDIADNYSVGEERRDAILDKLELALEKNYRINNLSVPLDESGHTERVWDSNITSVLFDSSGQDSYYTFTSELYLSVDTQRN